VSPRRDGAPRSDGRPPTRRGAGLADLALGLRLALGGGRGSRLRAALTAVGVGLGVALLLGAASIPTMLTAGQERSATRADLGRAIPAGPRTLLTADTTTEFRGAEVRGRDVQREGAQAPAPPGLRTLPAPGTAVVSPALAELLAQPGSALLRERLGARVVGEIAPAGLLGPAELAFYRGTDRLLGPERSDNRRIASFGSPDDPTPLGPLLGLFVAIAVVVLLLPIVVFIAAAVRFGGEDRDRRLAALRLVGADRAMTARIAAGETLLGAGAGVLAGAVLFVASRPLVEGFSLEDLSVFAGDVRPSAALATLVALAVPLVAVLVSLAALRGAVIEPLGVTRRAGAPRRRLWWRIVPALLALALLLPLRDGLSTDGGSTPEYQAAVGVLFGLLALTAVLPWLVEVVVRRLGNGPLAWQLATRRLRADGGTAARVVSGIAVAVAGAIALQMLFTAAEREATSPTGVAAERLGQVSVAVDRPAGGGAAAVVSAVRASSGVRSAFGVSRVPATIPERPDAYLDVVVASCATLAQYVSTRRCADGDVLAVPDDEGRALARAGEEVVLGAEDGPRERWTVPKELRAATPVRRLGYDTGTTLYATPGALAESRLPAGSAETYATLAPGAPDALELLRNRAAVIDPGAGIYELRGTDQSRTFANVRRGLLLASFAVLLLIGASLLVGGLEQLRERRRVLAVLVAFGTRRRTLAASVLWQTAVPVVLGLVVSIVTGLGLGVLLLRVAGQPVGVDWAAVAMLAAAGAAIVASVTLATMPALWRGMRPDGLRTE